LKGISVDAHVHLWKRVAELARELENSAGNDEDQLVLLAALGPAFLLRIRGTIEIDVDEEMQQKL
jgi:hypothetical protein